MRDITEDRFVSALIIFERLLVFEIVSLARGLRDQGLIISAAPCHGVRRGSEANVGIADERSSFLKVGPS